jgi:hypothetical protein
VNDLAGGVDTSVGAAGHDDGRDDRGAGGLLGQRVLDEALDGAEAWLAGPAGKVCAVVADL